MKVSYFALLRNVTQKETEEWDRPAATLRDLITDLIEEYGPEFARHLSKDGDLAGYAVVFINGRNSRNLQDLDTPLKPDANVLIFPPIAGG